MDDSVTYAARLARPRGQAGPAALVGALLVVVVLLLGTFWGDARPYTEEEKDGFRKVYVVDHLLWSETVEEIRETCGPTCEIPDEPVLATARTDTESFDRLSPSILSRFAFVFGIVAAAAGAVLGRRAVLASRAGRRPGAVAGGTVLVAAGGAAILSVTVAAAVFFYLWSMFALRSGRSALPDEALAVLSGATARFVLVMVLVTLVGVGLGMLLRSAVAVGALAVGAVLLDLELFGSTSQAFGLVRPMVLTEAIANGGTTVGVGQLCLREVCPGTDVIASAGGAVAVVGSVVLVLLVLGRCVLRAVHRPAGGRPRDTEPAARWPGSGFSAASEQSAEQP